MSFRAMSAWLFVLFLSPAMSVSADQVPIVNNSGLTVHVWLWGGGEQKWVESPLVLGIGEAASFAFAGNGRYYVVARTNSRDWVCGWADFRRLLERSPGAAFVLTPELVVEKAEVIDTIYKPVYEQLSRVITVWRRVYTNGCVTLVPETVTEHYTIMHMVPETRVRIVDITRSGVDATAADLNGNLTSRVTLQTEKAGAVIRYQLAARKTINTSRTPTTSTDDIAVGIYYLWAERQGKTTSEKFIHEIYAQQLTIKIPEGIAEQ